MRRQRTPQPGGLPRLSLRVAAVPPALHRQPDALRGVGQRRQIQGRVAFHHQQVGKGAGHQLADLVLAAHQLRGHDGGRLQHLHRRLHRGTDEELAALPVVHVAQQVGAEDHRHTFGARHGQRVQALALHDLELGQHGRTPAQARAFVGQRDAGRQRRHEIRAVALHLAQRGLVDEVAVFDAAHTRLNGACHRPWRIGMGQRVQVRGLVDRGAEFFDAELRAVDGVGGAGDATPGHDLDVVGAVAHLLAHGTPHLAHAVGDRAHQAEAGAAAEHRGLHA
jgi:hypothetical protein